ncbi:hypothetical protein GGS24DRAFT_336579 [Hypoxylon argillaceum]|nr:hypothetical protein GGS24DRAFT_336579 [Hypoxylon argillaceum]
MSVSKPKALTWRVTEIPTGTTKEQLVHFFEYEDRDRISVNSLCPDASGGNELTATLLYQPHPDRPDEGPKFTHGKPRDVSIDKDFEHWTPLYCPPAGTIIAADIIAITGLSGHAFGSWAYSEENMWLRDDVYKFAPNARILTYGYNTPLVGPNMSIVRMSDLSDTFYENLINMREDSKCEQRPIIFIGHSLGCMIIKKAMIIARERNVVSSRLPVRCIIFLAAPHRGMDVTALQNVVKNSPPEQLVEELRPESETLKLLNEGFSRTAQDIDILTCYETRPTKTMAFDEAKQKWTRSGESTMILDPSSANQYWPKEKRILADADHSSIAKLKKNKTIFSNVRAAISRALIPTAQISREERNNNAQGHNWVSSSS